MTWRCQAHVGYNNAACVYVCVYVCVCITVCVCVLQAQTDDDLLLAIKLMRGCYELYRVRGMHWSLRVHAPHTHTCVQKPTTYCACAQAHLCWLISARQDRISWLTKTGLLQRSAMCVCVCAHRTHRQVWRVM